MNESCDVVVIGGGPSGSTAGRLLAEWGYSVIIVDFRGSRNLSLAESIPPSCRKLFAFLQILDAIDAAGFIRSGGNTVWWGESECRVEKFQPAPGYQVSRSGFDALLLERARWAGARVFGDSPAREILFEGGEVRVSCGREQASTRSICARIALDCSGRTGILARRGLRQAGSEHSTVALVGVWRREGGWDLADPSHTLVETYHDGWCWSVPVSREVRYFTFMIDARDTQIERGSKLEGAYAAEVRKTERMRALLEDAERSQAIWGCDASIYHSRNYCGEQFYLVGDASSFIDPLSSFGVKKALASAWTAAVAVNTCLKSPEKSPHARAFYSGREEQVYRSYARQAIRYYRTAAVRHPSAFWTTRAALRCDEDLWEPDEDSLMTDPEVRAALKKLQASKEIRLTLSKDARIETKPGIREREVVLEPALVAPGLPFGLRYLGGVDLPGLVEIVGSCRRVPDLYEAYTRTHPSVQLENFLAALSTLLAKGVLGTDYEYLID